MLTLVLPQVLSKKLGIKSQSAKQKSLTKNLVLQVRYYALRASNGGNLARWNPSLLNKLVQKSLTPAKLVVIQSSN